LRCCANGARQKAGSATSRTGMRAVSVLCSGLQSNYRFIDSGCPGSLVNLPADRVGPAVAAVGERASNRDVRGRECWGLGPNGALAPDTRWLPASHVSPQSGRSAGSPCAQVHAAQLSIPAFPLASLVRLRDRRRCYFRSRHVYLGVGRGTKERLPARLCCHHHTASTKHTNTHTINSPPHKSDSIVAQCIARRTRNSIPATPHT